MESLKIGLITPTRGNDRKVFLDHAKWQMSRQTVSPHIVLIVDYEPESNEKDISQRYRRGFENLFNEEKCDCVLCWEDDDFYKTDYIETMVKLWLKNGKPTMFGFNYSIYYNINDQKWFNVAHPGRSSMMNTLVSPEILKEDWSKIPDNDPWTDYRLWTTCKNVKAVKYDRYMCVGIKHNIGMVGGNNHASIYQNADKKHIVDDDGMKWLEAICDPKSIQLYRRLSSTYVETKEVKEMDIVVPCNTLNKSLQDMTKQFILNCKNSDPNIRFNIYLLEQNKTIHYEGVQTIYYDFDFNYNQVMNYGFSFTKNKYVCFCNNDVNFSYGWATEIIKQMQKHNIMSASPFNPVICDKMTSEVKEGFEVRKEMLGWCIVNDRGIFDIIGKLNEMVNFWESEVIYSDQLKAAKLKHILVRDSVVFHYDTSRTLNLIDKAKQHEYTTKQVEKYGKIRSQL